MRKTIFISLSLGVNWVSANCNHLGLMATALGALEKGGQSALMSGELLHGLLVGLAWVSLHVLDQILHLLNLVLNCLVLSVVRSEHLQLILSVLHQLLTASDELSRGQRLGWVWVDLVDDDVQLLRDSVLQVQLLNDHY